MTPCLESHIKPGQGLWIRVATDAWSHGRRRSPHDKAGMKLLRLPLRHRLAPVAVRPVRGRIRRRRPSRRRCPTLGRPSTGYAGGDARIQVLASSGQGRSTDMRVFLKADLPDDDPRIGHVGAHLRRRRLARARSPGDVRDHLRGPRRPAQHVPARREFEGHPLRKEFPLLARVVKPWPGSSTWSRCPAATTRTRSRRPPSQEETTHDAPHRRAAAGVRQRAGGRRPRQRRARDRGRHGPQHGPAAPGHARHAAPRRPTRR